MSLEEPGKEQREDVLGKKAARKNELVHWRK